ncbi:MAG: hypothetical protein AAFP89_25680, partial [Bacteroidota bacterium]
LIIGLELFITSLLSVPSGTNETLALTRGTLALTDGNHYLSIQESHPKVQTEQEYYQVPASLNVAQYPTLRSQGTQPSIYPGN